VIRRTLFVVLLATGVVATTAVPGTAAESSDQQIARAGVLVRADFPTGWKSSTRAPTADTSFDATAAQVPSCTPFLTFSRANKSRPRARSQNFDHAQSHVTNAVSVYPSTAKATVAMRTFSDPRLPDCFQKVYSAVYERQLAKNDQITSVSAAVAPVADVRIGDEAVAYQGTLAVALADGTTQTIGIGVVTARVGDAVVGYSWTSDTDISAALQPAIVQSVNRLQKAQSTG
jgi:hypothetical protein